MKKKSCHCTFHWDWRRARGGECVNIGEGPFARLIKGLDAERIRGRLIKPLDFVCVAWSFIQGYKSAKTGTLKSVGEKEKGFNNEQNMTKSKRYECLLCQGIYTGTSSAAVSFHCEHTIC